MADDPFDKVRIEPRPQPLIAQAWPRLRDESATCEKCLRPFRRSTEQTWRKRCGCCR